MHNKKRQIPGEKATDDSFAINEMRNEFRYITIQLNDRFADLQELAKDCDKQLHTLVDRKNLCGKQKD